MSYLRAWWLAMATAGTPAPVPPALTPAPGWAWRSEADLQMPAQRQLLTLPGLSTAYSTTLFLVFNKDPSAEDIHMLCSLPTADGQEVDLCYTGRYYGNGWNGFGYNAYANGFLTAADVAYLDNGAVRLVRATLYNNVEAGYNAWFNGVSEPQFGRAGAQYPGRPFTNLFYLGGDYLSGLNWQGHVLACYIYVGPLSEADAIQTETYLRALFPAIS